MLVFLTVFFVGFLVTFLEVEAGFLVATLAAVFDLAAATAGTTAAMGGTPGRQFLRLARLRRRPNLFPKRGRHWLRGEAGPEF